MGLTGFFRKTKLLDILSLTGLIGTSLIPILAAINNSTYLTDDTYITLTYAKNLASGNGFVFNHPPAILGTTTPLFTLVTGAIGAVFPQLTIDGIAVTLSALCWLGIGLLFYFYRAVWQLKNWQAMVLAAVINCTPWFFSLGMEAYPFAFTLVLVFSLFLKKAYLWAGLTSGLLPLIRGEGFILFPMLVGIIVIKDVLIPRAPLEAAVKPVVTTAVGFGIPMIIWAAYSGITFGVFLPNTLAAKQAQGDSVFGISILHRIFTEWIPLWGGQFVIGKVAWLNPWWIFWLLGVVLMAKKLKAFMLFAAWVLLYVSGYQLLGVTAYWWYQLPVLFVMNLLSGLGMIYLFTILASRVKSFRLAAAASGMLLIYLLYVLFVPTIKTIYTYPGDPRGPSYRALAKWVNENTNQDDSISFLEIGYLGFYTDRKIIDLAGLVTPDISPHIAESDYAWGFWHYLPNYYIYLPTQAGMTGSIISDARFSTSYLGVSNIKGPRESVFYIYKRRK